MNEIAKTWVEAKVLEPLGFVDEEMHTVGAVVLGANIPTILSLDPGADFELNTDIIQQWKIVFQNSEGEVLGDADYTQTLRELREYIVDQQNGSVLVRALSDDELYELHAKTIFE